MRLAVEEGEPQVVLELLVVCLAHLEAGVGLIVEILVSLPQLLDLPDAVVHERAVAWDARKDAELAQVLPLQEDIRNQAGYLACRRLSCC